MPGTYSIWTITSQIAGHPQVINQIVAPDADARFIVSSSGIQFYSEFLNQPGVFTVQYYGFTYSRESNPTPQSVSAFISNDNYDGSTADYGIHVVGIGGHNGIEFTNAPGNSDLPGNLPFSFAP